MGNESRGKKGISERVLEGEGGEREASILVLKLEENELEVV